MSGKWTPGPWRADLGETYRACDRQNQTVAWATFVFSSAKATVRRESEEVAANARLIAAAPELAEALEALVEETADMLTWGCEPDVIRNARAALAKAKGEGA